MKIRMSNEYRNKIKELIVDESGKTPIDFLRTSRIKDINIANAMLEGTLYDEFHTRHRLSIYEDMGIMNAPNSIKMDTLNFCEWLTLGGWIPEEILNKYLQGIYYGCDKNRGYLPYKYKTSDPDFMVDGIPVDIKTDFSNRFKYQHTMRINKYNFDRMFKQGVMIINLNLDNRKAAILDLIQAKPTAKYCTFKNVEYCEFEDMKDVLISKHDSNVKNLDYWD